MFPICCDTSFLFSLYEPDANTARALAYIKRIRQPLTLSPFNVFEFEHALQHAIWRRQLPDSQAAIVLSAFRADVEAGQLIFAQANLGTILREARRLSALYAAKQGYRLFDILQVAAALHLGAGQFLSFDANQRKLALAEGLKLNP